MKMQGLWWRSPLSIRITVLCALLLFSILLSVFQAYGHNYVTWGAIVIVVYLLYIAKAFSFGRMTIYFAYTLTVPVLASVLYEHSTSIDFSQSSTFVLNYHSFVLYLVFSAVLVRGFMTDELVHIASRITPVTRCLQYVVITLSTAWLSLFGPYGVLGKTSECLLLSRPRAWTCQENCGLPRWLEKAFALFDRLLVGFLIALTSAHEMGNVLDHWRLRRSASTKEELSAILLNDVYMIDNFPFVYASVFGSLPIDPVWVHRLGELSLVRNLSVLDVGSGTGRLVPTLHGFGLEVVAIESNTELYNICSAAVDLLDGATAIHGSFPDDVLSSSFDLVVLHQNVFAELVATSGIRNTFSSLANAVERDGFIVFDYPTKISLPEQNRPIKVLDTEVDMIGHVEYSYTIVSSESNSYNILLSFTVSNSSGFVKSRTVPLQVSLPNIKELLDCATSHGFAVSSIEALSEYTFFPAEMSLFCLRKIA